MKNIKSTKKKLVTISNELNGKELFSKKVEQAKKTLIGLKTLPI